MLQVGFVLNSFRVLQNLWSKLVSIMTDLFIQEHVGCQTCAVSRATSFDDLLATPDLFFESQENIQVAVSNFPFYIDQLLEMQETPVFTLSLCCIHMVDAKEGNCDIDPRVETLFIKILNTEYDPTEYACMFKIRGDNVNYKVQCIKNVISMCPDACLDTLLNMVCIDIMLNTNPEVVALFMYIMDNYSWTISQRVLFKAFYGKERKYELTRLLLNKSTVDGVCGLSYGNMHRCSTLLSAMQFDITGDLFRMLIDAGFNLTYEQHLNLSNNAFDFSVEYCPNLFNELLAQGGDINLQSSTYKHTHLMKVSAIKDEELTIQAVNAGSNCCLFDLYGRVALLFWYTPTFVDFYRNPGYWQEWSSKESAWLLSSYDKRYPTVDDLLTQTTPRAPQCLFDNTPEDYVRAFLEHNDSPEARALVEFVLAQYAAPF